MSNNVIHNNYYEVACKTLYNVSSKHAGEAQSSSGLASLQVQRKEANPKGLNNNKLGVSL